MEIRSSQKSRERFVARARAGQCEPLFRLWLSEALQALRALLAAPRFSAPALLSLALGMGASTAVFALFSAVLLRPLRFGSEQQLVDVSVQTASRGGSGADIFGMSAPFVRELGELRSVFASVSAYRGREVTLTQNGSPRLATAAAVTPEFFDTLQPEVALGRTFGQRGPAPDGPDVVVLRRSYWLSALGGVAVIGQSVLIDGQPKTVLGVLDDDAALPAWADVWLPMRFTAEDYRHRFLIPLEGLGRLEPGLSLAVAAQRLREDDVRRNVVSGDGTLCATKIEPLRERTLGSKRQPVTLLASAVISLFLLACANVAALLVTRATATSPSLAVRRALGARPATLLRLCAFEVLFLTLAGALIGLSIAAGLVWLANDQWQGLESVPARLDLRVLAGLPALGLLGGLLIGIIPALYTLHVQPMDALRGSGRSSAGRGARRLRELLVALQVSVSVLLLGSAGIIGRSLHNLHRVDTGFDRRAIGLRVLLPPLAGGDTPPDSQAVAQRMVRLSRALLERAQRIPGVRAAAVASSVPFRRAVMYGFDVAPPALLTRCHALVQLVGPEYFRTLGIGLLSGHYFEPTDVDVAGLDRAGSPVIVNRAFVDQVIGGAVGVGHEITFGSVSGNTPWLRIVGVVENVLAGEPELTNGIAPVVYSPFTGQFRPFGDSFALVARSSDKPEDALAALQAAVREVDASVPIYETDVLGVLTEQSYWQTRAIGWALGCFALVSLLLTATGLFGVTSYNVAERSSEIGIRRALGATRAGIACMLSFDTARVVLLGLMLGIGGAWAARRLWSGLLYGVDSADPLMYSCACLVVALLALLAALAAGRSATKIEPSRSLTRA